MKIIAAPNAFKGSLSALQAAQAIKRGIKRLPFPIEVVCLPVADGGDGLMDVFEKSLSGKVIETMVADPLQNQITAPICFLEKTSVGIVEMAKASGLVLVPEKFRNPEITTTFGTGQLIAKCLDLNATRIVVGLGGSATCDGGIGAAAALGYRFLAATGNVLQPTGGNLIHIRNVDGRQRDSRLDHVVVEAVCDVANPLIGPEGASYIYSPQKGATPEQVERLDKGLANLAAVIKKDMGIDLQDLPGTGAAGGLGAGVHAFFGGKLRKGIELVLDLVGFATELSDADLVITGEGSIDYQTKFDKAPAGVAKASQQAGVPCIAICGSMGEGVEELHSIGMTAVFSLCNRPIDLTQAISEAELLLADSAEQAVRLFISADIYHNP
jgi:glycerate 2-kinase